MRSVIIIGYGVVGKNMQKLFQDADIVDPHLGLLSAKNHHDVAFVCVPTPNDKDNRCDISNVIMAINENEAEVFCIKSAMPPGSTRAVMRQTGKLCVVSPEFFGETKHANAVDYDFVILGGSKDLTRQVAEVFKEHTAGTYRIFQTDCETAELVKYMENSFLALKVTFCNEFYRLAKEIGVDYNELRELWLLDPRVGRSHTFVYEDRPYYDSKCLNKDIPALITFAIEHGVNMPLMWRVETLNAKHKEQAHGE